MKKLFCVLATLLFTCSISVFAAPVTKKKNRKSSFIIEVEIKRFWGDIKKADPLSYKKTISLESGKNIEFTFPDQSHTVDLYVSKDLPKGLEQTSSKELLRYDMKIYENKDGQKKLMSSPEVVAYLGKEAKISSVNEKHAGFEILLNSSKAK